jgi:protein subunit release factor A
VHGNSVRYLIPKDPDSKRRHRIKIKAPIGKKEVFYEEVFNKYHLWKNNDKWKILIIHYNSVRCQCGKSNTV